LTRAQSARSIVVLIRRHDPRRALLEPIGLHDECRQTFASTMIAAGVKAKALSTLRPLWTTILNTERRVAAIGQARPHLAASATVGMSSEEQGLGFSQRPQTSDPC
jgi:hypothetical protein